MWVLEPGFGSCGTWAQVLCSMRKPPGPGIKPMSSAPWVGSHPLRHQVPRKEFCIHFWVLRREMPLPPLSHLPGNCRLHKSLPGLPGCPQTLHRPETMLAGLRCLGSTRQPCGLGKRQKKEESSTGFLFKCFTEAQSGSRRDLGQTSRMYKI